MTRTKKILFFLLVFITLFGSAQLVFSKQSVGRDLEIKYPEIAGEHPEKVTTPVPEYVRYIYNGLIWLSGLIALIVLIIGGFEWFTSAGNVDGIRSAKDRISAAILGIIILFGSYLILIRINPELVVFHLPRLRPIISKLTPGVLLCNGQVEAPKAWDLANEFEYSNPSEDREKEIKKELDAILDKVALNCSTVNGAGNITGNTENIRFIYFIPDIQINEDKSLKSATEYGAIIYEDSNFEGKSVPFYEHLLPGGDIMVYEKSKKSQFPDLSPSSIKPFILIPEHHGGYERNGIKYQVFLFQEFDRNIGTNLENKGKMYGINIIEPYTDANGNGRWDPDEPYTDANGNGQRDPGIWWGEWDDIIKSFGSLPGARCEKDYCSPRSIQVLGDYIAILLTPDGRSDTFYNEVDNNLDDNVNIVNEVDCDDYKDGTKKQCEGFAPASMGGGGTYQYTCCTKPAVNKLIIISASIY